MLFSGGFDSVVDSIDMRGLVRMDMHELCSIDMHELCSIGMSGLWCAVSAREVQSVHSIWCFN